VIEEVVVRIGVTPLATAIFGVTVPAYQMPGVRPELDESEKCVIVSVPAVHCANVIAEVGAAVALADVGVEIAQPPAALDRVVTTARYPV